MKAKELMVGDWVQALCENYEPYEVVLEKSQITHINRETIYVANGNIFYGEDGEMRRYSVAEPIPLTEEILKKNGFVKEQERPTKMYRKWLGEYVEDGFVLVVFHNFESGSEIALHIETIPPHIHADLMVVVENVHEMQHALRLCGLRDLADNLKVE